MAVLKNIVRVYTPTVGAGVITLGAAVQGYKDFIQAGCVNGETYTYGIHDFDVVGNLIASEVGRGTYNAVFNTFTRTTVLASTNIDAELVLTGRAQIFITAIAEDFITYINQLTGDVTAGPGSGSVATTISPEAVTLGKMAKLNALSLIGNNTGVLSTPSALNITDVLAMLGVGPILIDTEANILATSPATKIFAIGQDTNQLYVADGTNWRIQPPLTGLVSQGPDVGPFSAKDDNGYGQSNLTDKYLHNIVFKWFDPSSPIGTQKGAIRYNPSLVPPCLQIYNGSIWTNLVALTQSQVNDWVLVTMLYQGHSTIVPGTVLANRRQMTLGFSDPGVFPSDVVLDGGELI